ncbi:hypothetical protein [Rubricoccus marinus]|uniref:TonB-dependent receptor-like beta-barrel domain-containing protein n=1 Tax=Rubricoccus marinus TaxID=716817 RepID=A0A259TYK8_9BACT|nr:hypothetical protein [Rubricoccus marinus]OZC02853.1 hypothetical protein BSZ36_07630 [Rubricoccus marinus]
MVAPIRSALVLFLLGAASAASAQDPTPDPRVPSLTPREFEIRGDVRVALPQIERQPLSGFGPPPRNYVVPADRAAVTAAYDPDLADLPALVLAPPSQPDADILVPERLRAEGTYGNSAARTGRFNLALPVASGQLLADADYDGLGASDDADEVGFDRLSGGASIRTGGAVQFELFGRGLFDRYGLPGIRERQNLTSTPIRSLTQFEGGVGVEGLGATPFLLQARYSADRLEPENASLMSGIGEDQSAGQVDARGEITLFDRVRVDAGGGVIGLDGGLGQDVQYGAAGAAIRLGRPGGPELTLGARGLAYTVASGAGDGDATAIAPIVDLSIPAGPTIRLFASNDPMLVTRGLADHFQVNPFATAQPVLAPDVLRVNARAGAEITNGPVRLRGFAHYVEAPTWLVFDRSGDGLFIEGYESVRVQGVTAEAAIVSRSGISFEAGVTLRESRISDSGGVNVIPFYAPNTARAGVQVPFSRGRLALTAYRVAERPADRADRTSAPAYGVLSADARFDIASMISVVAQADRLAGTVEEWPGYRLPGTTVRAGLRVTL